MAVGRSPSTCQGEAVRISKSDAGMPPCARVPGCVHVEEGQKALATKGPLFFTAL